MDKLNQWYDLSGRVAFLTGAAGFIGPSYARALAERGASVVVVDVEQEKCERVASDLRQQYGGRVTPLSLDVANAAAVKDAVGRVMDEYGRLDILINNAAFHQLSHIKGGNEATLENFPLDVWQKTIDVNLTGALICSQEAGRIMLQQKAGVMLNVASVYGVVAADQRIYGNSGLNSNVAYAVTKGGLVQFTRYLAAYWQGQNIRVNSLSPGGVFNNQSEEFLKNYTYKTMLGRMATLDDLTAAMLYLVSDASAFVTGFNMVVDGGWTAW